MIVHDVYGRVFSRPGLTLKERELINVTVLALQGLDRQLYSHLRGCLRVGVEVTVIREALSLVQRTSKRSMQTARTLLRLVVSQRKKL
jgi:alkylhydroperoxidase/carboxymuconolactone decarboxylase family protein YurZ